MSVAGGPVRLERPKSSADPSSLLHPALRKHLLKLAFADQWQQSLLESHLPGDALDAVIATHHVEVTVIRRALAAHLALPPPMLDEVVASLMASPPAAPVDWLL